MRPAATLELNANAKVNLGLAVIARRGDGFHEVETWMARISLADTLVVTIVEDPGVTLSLQGVHDVPVDGTNLAVRAAEAYLGRLAELTGATAPGVRIDLTKRVPVAAGLGGGSSDAGAVLRALTELLPLPDTASSRDEVLKLAAALGSDVPFFAADMAFALAKGRGERLAPAPAYLGHLVLVNPGLHVSAADAYRSLVGFSPRLKVESLLERLANGEEPRWHNALQAGVQRAHPVIRDVIGALKTAGARGALMSGSGSTCFGLAADAAEAHSMVEEISAARPEWWVHHVVTG